MKVIRMVYGEAKRLQVDFKTSRFIVQSALRFDTNSRIAKVLRRAAIERGGILFIDGERQQNVRQCDL